MPRWAEALRSEIKKHRDLLTKLEDKQHKNSSRKKASAQQFIFEFGIKGVRRVLNKHSKATAMNAVYWECPFGFKWAWSEGTPPADRKSQDVLPSLQEQMRKTGEKYTLVIDSEGIAVSTETLTHMAGLLDWATSFQGGPQLQQPSLILSTGQWRDENLIAAAESFFQTNAYQPFATCARGYTGPVPMSRKKAAPADGKDTSPRRSIDHICPHVECKGRDPQHFRSNKSAVRDTMFLEETGIFSYRTFGKKERLGYPIASFREFNLFINRIANRKASGEDKVPADLFKKAPETFRTEGLRYDSHRPAGDDYRQPHPHRTL